MLRRRLKQDDGQVSLAVILLALSVLAASVGAFVFAEAIDVRSRAQKAADAAALAAAKTVRENMVRAWAFGVIPPATAGSPGIFQQPSAVFAATSMTGYGSATSFAGRNESTLTSYRPGAFTIAVGTKSNEKNVESPVASKAKKSLSSPAKATAITDGSGVVCIPAPSLPNPAEPTLPGDWWVTCTGNGQSVTLNYFGPSPIPLDYALKKDSLLKLYPIRLTE